MHRRHHQPHSHHLHIHAGDQPHGRGRGRRRGRGGRGKAMRGEVRNAILHLLIEEPMHGYQIMQEIHERSENAWQPSPGSIYPTLQQLADEGLVIGETQSGKNVFSLTDSGREAASELDETPPWERLSGGQSAGAHAMRSAMTQLVAAARIVGSTGTDAQIERASELINEARKGIYALLASDD